MPDFETYLKRHGEFGVQALVERWERYEGVRVSAGTALKARWVAFTGNGSASVRHQQNVAA
jgi:hypothetical protein